MSRKRLSDCKTRCQYILLASAERYCFVSALIHGHKTADDLAAKKRALGAQQRCGSASHTSGTSGFRDLTWVIILFLEFSQRFPLLGNTGQVTAILALVCRS